MSAQLKRCCLLCRSQHQAILIDSQSGVLYQVAVKYDTPDIKTMNDATYHQLFDFMRAHDLRNALIAYAGMDRSNYLDYQLFYRRYTVGTAWRHYDLPDWKDETLAQSFELYSRRGSSLRFHQISGMWFAEVRWYRWRNVLRLEDGFFRGKDVDETVKALQALMALRPNHPGNPLVIDREDLRLFLRAVQTGRMPPNASYPPEIFGNMLLVFFHDGNILMDQFSGQLYRIAGDTMEELTYTQLQEILRMHAPKEWRETLNGLSEKNFEQYKHHLFGTYGRENQSFPPKIEPFIEAVNLASFRTEPWFVSPAENGNWTLYRAEDFCHGGNCSEYSCVVPAAYFGGKSVNDMLYNDLKWEPVS